MSDPLASSTSSELALSKISALFSEEIRIMTATLAMSSLGSVSIVEYADEAVRQTLFEYFRRHLLKDRVCLEAIQIHPQQLDIADSIQEWMDSDAFQQQLAHNRCGRCTFFVYGVETLAPSDRLRFFQLLERLPEKLKEMASPVVIWVGANYITEMIQLAPTFWLRKGELFSFSDVVPQDDDLPFVQRYLNAVLVDPSYNVWRDRYTPLSATRISETLNLITPRHTLTESELNQLVQLFPDDIMSIEANHVILEKDAEDRGCYILLDGEVNIIVPDSLSNDFILDRLSRGDFFGEIALVKNVPRTATVRSVTPCRYIVLTKFKLRMAASQITNLLKLMSKIAEYRLDALVKAPTEVRSPLRRFADQDNFDDSVQTPRSLTDLLTETKRMIVLGDAGAGKTTALQALTLTLAEQANYAFSHGQLLRIPIFIDINKLTAENAIEDLILDDLRQYNLISADNRAALLTILNEANISLESLVFLIDGLNEYWLSEMSDDLDEHDRADQLEAINAFIQTFDTSSFILTSRTQSYTPIDAFRAVLLQPLTEREIGPFLTRYIGEQRGKQLSDAIQNDDHLLELAQQPLILQALIQLVQQGTTDLPKNRGLLFEQIITKLLNRVNAEKPGRTDASTGQYLPMLAELGFILHDTRISPFPIKEWQTSVPVEQVPLGQSFLQTVNLLESSGLIRSSGDRQRQTVEFLHDAYQSFCAALGLREKKEAIEPYLDTPEVLQNWSDIIVLLYGISTNRPALFSQVLGQGDNYARIWIAAQCVASSGEEIAVATENFEKTLDKSQQFAMLFSMGLASNLVGRYPESLAYLQQASAIQPGNAEVDYELGSLYRQLGQYDSAISFLSASIDLRPDFVDAYNQLGITYYNQRKYEEALTVFTVAIQLEPNNAHHYYNLGSVQKVLKDYEAARQAFQKAHELQPDYTEAKIQLDLLERAFSAGVVKVLRSVPMLSKLTLEQTIMLANRMNVVEHEAGDIVFNMGKKGDTFYIVEQGLLEEYSARLSDPTDSSGSNAREFKEGDFFGEVALLRSVPRTATVRCATDVRLLEIARKDFNDIVDHYPSIAYRLAQTAKQRFTPHRKGDRISNPYYNPNYLQQMLDRQNEATVLMGDIHGSTFLTNSIGPELMVAFLDEYLKRMTQIIVKSGGAADKSLGDSVMGVFGQFPERSNETDVSPAVRSLMAGLQMRQAYLDLREEWKSRSAIFMQTGMGIGINTGAVKIGTVGAEASMVGTAVNVSSKLSKMAVGGRNESEIYIDRKTFDMLGDAIEVEAIDPDYVFKKAGGVELEVFRVVRDLNLKL